MSLKSLRTPLRHTAVAVVAASAICLPATSAFADSGPKPSPRTERETRVERSPDATKSPGRERGAKGSEGRGETPRGGVEAGEKPAATSADGTTAAVGTAAGALLLAGAGTLVIRRRAAARHDG
ncbi:sortase-dependent protein [Streptomyces tubercidicus]|uniref:sortase-dependent protein n=1 Tax=Streptomyces tubercidicus TaxID=47759 RepID=UPI0030DFF645